MGRIVIAAYRPKAGKSEALEALMSTHVDRLRREGLVTHREPITMKAADGTIIEVFEWASKAAMEEAHQNPNVQRMWAEYAEVCEYVPVASVSEAENLFSEFTPLD